MTWEAEVYEKMAPLNQWVREAGNVLVGAAMLARLHCWIAEDWSGACLKAIKKSAKLIENVRLTAWAVARRN